MRTSGRRLLLAVVASLDLAVGAAAEDTPSPDAAWVKANAHTFTTVEAGHGFDDLAFLEKTIGDARVVGLGEATHGTREHFQMKHRMLEFLATKMGFNVFAIEANMPESYRVDRYVTGGTGDPAALIGGMYFWTWNTEEVLDMVKWMRAFNEREAAAKSGKHVQFAGFDMQAPEYPQTLVRRFVEKHDADYLPSLRENWELVAAAEQGSGGAFGCTNLIIPPEAARGRKLRFSGFIRTEDVDGFAGLWARADCSDAPNEAFDNMSDRGPKGTTPWRPYVLELDIPKDAAFVVVGTLLSGSGSAWFDSLRLELDEKPCASLADASIEERELGPFPRENAFPGGAGCEIRADDGQAKDGKRSLLMRRPAAPPSRGRELPAARAVLAHLTESRQRFLDAKVPAADADWAIQNAQIVVQAMEMFASEDGGAVRDSSMAANVRWILDQDPAAKIVLWAHNFHVSGMTPWMGSHLKKSLGAKYVNFGFLAGSGSYYARGPESDGAPSPHVHRLQEPADGSIELIFRRSGMPLSIVDLRGAPSLEPGASWIREKHGFGHIGAARRDDRFDPITAGDAFDVLVYVDQTTAARQLKTPPADGPPED